MTPVNGAPVASGGDYVLYWMIGARRTSWSFALDHALARASELGVPLVVLEPLRAGYRWASARLHRFVLDGMAAQARAFAAAEIGYHPYVEPEAGAGKGLLEAAAARAALVVTDEQPGFFLPRMVAAAGARLPVRLEQVDGAGVLPLRASDRAFPTAAAFRRHWQKIVAPHLIGAPAPAPLRTAAPVARGGALPASVTRRWPAAPVALLAGDLGALARLPIDQTVGPVGYPGGEPAGRAVIERFVGERLEAYGDDRNHPDLDGGSGLSPYLHFGHVGVHEVLRRVWDQTGWDPSRLTTARAHGRRDGWWGLPGSAEGFLDELITWRELGAGFCFHRPDYDRYESLPGWAQTTLDAHAGDPRSHRYSLEQLAAAATHDPLWNAAQTQLVREGRIHNYLRMLWGKHILAWSPSPRAALATLIELNNRYAVDGRDPNSYAGIFWTLGRFDRPWGPERPVFGLIRYMTSENTARKLKVKAYLRRWDPRTPA